MVKTRPIGQKLKGGGVQLNPFSMKTKDKYKNKPLRLKQFGLKKTLPEIIREEIASYDKATGKKNKQKNLTKKKDGTVVAKKVYGVKE